MDEAAPIPTEARELLDFWFGAPGSPEHGEDRKVWFTKDAAFDASVRSRFGALIERALRGELEDWAATPHGALARILLLDQLTRNAFRGDRRSFAGDAQALAAASAMVGQHQDEALPPFMPSFVYLPFEHAEGLAMQDEAVRLFTRLVAVEPALASNLDYACRHRDVIERFGRFLHRNELLGRQSTAEELDFLTRPGSRF